MGSLVRSTLHHFAHCRLRIAQRETQSLSLWAHSSWGAACSCVCGRQSFHHCGQRAADCRSGQRCTVYHWGDLLLRSVCGSLRASRKSVVGAPRHLHGRWVCRCWLVEKKVGGHPSAHGLGV
jgi:hypothetical protein